MSDPSTSTRATSSPLDILLKAIKDLGDKFDEVKEELREMKIQIAKNGGGIALGSITVRNNGKSSQFEKGKLSIHIYIFAIS